MARLPKCPECEYQVDKDTQRWVKHSSKTYHEHCFQQFEKRKTDRDDLHTYICELYRIPVVNGYMLKQIKEFTETYKFTLKGMQMALYYFHQILGNPVEVENPNPKYKNVKGVGIIPHIYEDAKRHYITMANITQKASETKFEGKEEVIYLKPTTKKIRKNYIDIEGILND